MKRLPVEDQLQDIFIECCAADCLGAPLHIMKIIKIPASVPSSTSQQSEGRVCLKDCPSHNQEQQELYEQNNTPQRQQKTTEKLTESMY